MNDDDSIQKKETSIIINNNKPDLPEISKKSKSQNPKEKKLKKLKTAFLRSKTNFRFPQKKFEEETLDRAINLLIYGKKLLKFCKEGKIAHMCHFYIHEDSPNYLQWISNKKVYGNSRLELNKITNLSDDPVWKLARYFRRNNNIICLTYENSSQKEIDMLLKFPNEETKLFWWQGLQHFIKKAFDNSQRAIDPKKLIAQKLFFQADKDGSKTLNFEETKKILQQLHIEITKDYLKHLFEKYDKDRNNTIDLNEFQDIISDITQKKEVTEIFQLFSKEAAKIKDLNQNLEIMKESDIWDFFKNVQKEIITLEEIRVLILCLRNITSQKSFSNFINASKLTNEKFMISLSEFSSILFSFNNRIFDPNKEDIYQNMDHPLSDYYINSSHNTYLMANQLTGESSTKAYINAFLRGVRCVELDCWDGEKGEPIIYHGFTLTSRISFEDVIKTINDYGFENNLYPIILSIENHCKSKQQERMAEILIKILGDKLYKLPEDYQKYEYYPSPNQLKKKVIIKDKGKLPNFEQKMLEMIDTDLNMLDFDEEVVYMDQKSKNLLNWEEMKLITTVFEKYDLNLRYTLRPKTNFPSSQSKEKSFVSNLPLDENMKKSNKEMVNSLQNIEEKKLDSKQNIIILKKKEEEHHLSNVLHSMEIHKSKLNISNQESGVSKKKEEKEKNPIFQKILGMFGIKMNLDDSRSIWNISSINEEKISKFLKDREIEIIDFHRKYFTRIYPSGKRVDSSNYDPIDSFNVGAQIIALNVQTADIPLLIYFSKFVENGGSNCGYVLKPAFLLHDATKIKYINDFNNLKKILHIKVISGQQLRPEDEKDVRDVADPYVEVSLRGCFKDEAENHKTFKSIIVKNNGFNPIFNLEATFKIFCPELCLIIFKTFDQEGGLKKDMRLGWYSIPFHCIREGYRIVPLLNSHLKPIEFSYLFCHISIEDIK